MLAGPGDLAATVAGAFVVMVDVTELVMVDTVWVVWRISLVPDVIVFVTGHVVNVVYTL